MSDSRATEKEEQVYQHRLRQEEQQVIANNTKGPLQHISPKSLHNQNPPTDNNQERSMHLLTPHHRPQ